MKLYPLTFRLTFKERLWGGRNLESLYGKPLPTGVRIGESWEISDRLGDESFIANGSLQGRTLNSVLREDPKSSAWSGTAAIRAFSLAR